MNFIQSNERWLDAVPADRTSSHIRNVARLSPRGMDGPLPRIPEEALEWRSPSNPSTQFA